MKSSGFVFLNLILALFILTALFSISLNVPKEIFGGIKLNKKYIEEQQAEIYFSPTELQKLNCQEKQLQGNLKIRVCNNHANVTVLRYLEQK